MKSPKPSNSSENLAKELEPGQSFEDFVIGQSFKKPVLVNFFSHSSTPCIALKSKLEKIHVRHSEKFSLVHVNIKQHPKLLESHRVLHVPMVKYFVSGRKLAQFVGSMPDNQLEEWCRSNLKVK